MGARRDLTSKIVRLEVFEDRLGLRLDALSAFYDKEYDQLTVCGEIHAVNGSSIDKDICLQAAAYNENNQVVGTSAEFIDAKKFLGFDSFQICLHLPLSLIASIRIYPKPN